MNLQISYMIPVIVIGGFCTALARHGSMMLILSLVIGTVIGELLKIEEGFERLGTWLKEKTGNQGDTSFVDAFMTTALTICIGAMAVVGAVQDGLTGDTSTLLAKAILLLSLLPVHLRMLLIYLLVIF